MSTKNEPKWAATRTTWARLALVAAVALIVSCGRQPAPRAVQEENAPASNSRTTVSSSAMRSVGYDRDARVLEIEFTGGEVYQYFKVPASVHRGLMSAESHGRYLNEYVKGAGYEYRRVQ